MRVLNLVSLEALAEKKLTKNAFGYYVSGADDELALRRNRDAFSRVAIHHRVLVDVSVRTCATTVLGHPISMPVIVAPTAFHKLACEDGELATRRAATAAGTIMTLFKKTLKGSLFGDCNPTTDIPKILGLYQSGDIKLDEIITNTYTLDQVNQGYDDLLSGKNVRGVLVHEH